MYLKYLAIFVLVFFLMFVKVVLDLNYNLKKCSFYFQNLHFKHHPDSSAKSQSNTRRFTEIMEAYKVLGKKDSRAAYDNILNANIVGDPKDFNSYYGFQR